MQEPTRQQWLDYTAQVKAYLIEIEEYSNNYVDGGENPQVPKPPKPPKFDGWVSVRIKQS